MGGTESKKEEVIIAQAGNSGGQTNGASFSTKDILFIVVFVIVMLILLSILWERCNRKIDTKIKREVSRSREIL